MIEGKRKNNRFFYQLWLLVACTLLFYSFFFQYGIKPINGVMIILCTILILFGCIQIIFVQHGKIKKDRYLYFYIFLALGFIITIFMANAKYGLDLEIRMLEYLLSSYSIYLLLKSKPEYLNIITFNISITVTLLAVDSLIKGVVVSSSGAIGLQSLNTNVMSSFFLIMAYCIFILCRNKHNLIFELLLCIMMGIVVIAQISAASRRGFLVLGMFLFAAISVYFIPLRTRYRSRMRFLMYITLTVLVIIMLLIMKDYLLQKTVLGARLLGANNTGDLARARYQAFALEQFKNHPILGIGLGGIAYNVGAYSHSMYYELISCTGLLGTIIFFFGFLGIGYDLMMVSRNKTIIKEDRGLSWLSFIFWGCILISGIAVVMIYDFYFYIYISLLCAVLSRNRRKTQCIKN